MKKLPMIFLAIALPLTAQACTSNQNSSHSQQKQTEPQNHQAVQTAPVVNEQPAVANTPETPAKETQAQGIWIDVRSAEEYQEGHLNGAINIPHTEIANKIAGVTVNKDEPIHLYCRSGRRSDIALQELKKLGYTNITNHGGYDDLVKKNQESAK